MSAVRRMPLSVVLLCLWSCSEPAPEQDSRPTTAQSTPYVLARREGEVLLDAQGRTNIIKVSPATGASLLAMGTQDMPAGSSILVHRHDHTEEVLYIEEGSGTLILGNERIEIGAGATVWVPPGTWHGVENGNDHMHLLWFVTPPGLDGFLRSMFWPPGSPPKNLTPEQIAEIERQHDARARP